MNRRRRPARPGQAKFWFHPGSATTPIKPLIYHNFLIVAFSALGIEAMLNRMLFSDKSKVFAQNHSFCTKRRPQKLTAQTAWLTKAAFAMGKAAMI
jgi:hypothetical protein